MIALAALGHDTFLVFAVLPWAYARWVRPRPRWQVWSALAILPLWLALNPPVQARAPYDAPVVEHVGRVLFSVATAGLPVEVLRMTPLVHPYTRIREMGR